MLVSNKAHPEAIHSPFDDDAGNLAQVGRRSRLQPDFQSEGLSVHIFKIASVVGTL